MTNKVFSFPPQLRLRKPSEYKKVFTGPVKSSDAYFTLLAVRNELDHPRLGLAIAKKIIKKAVDRNMLKRTARESFRLQQHELINIDVVVMARKDALNASPEQLQKSLARHWLRLVNRCESYS
ncbi:MAG: ribonuclease P protein component [Gammaproteobacteria bacterium HGW-Gammaproteobacteria-10]|uniref:Ribonuclease P protein component n=1 Tax=Methylotuvimicrobium buryatense TaxID=95641 RepID=A0A4P9UT31_METBY|nr:ribonuclease P protein component [Methylotuvimicrobium buryatense]PKM36188.1 MAG: ribonuclease P protein component [Gammaproteobacteria bacterium HGW-Gammaproteobacteria-10]QCW84637.1 ribonuclease P protein component [Methylotuvimicrobium buryatense]HBA64841.1 ribonuclease P protein component [Methylococcaceae bacterium]